MAASKIELADGCPRADAAPGRGDPRRAGGGVQGHEVRRRPPRRGRRAGPHRGRRADRQGPEARGLRAGAADRRGGQGRRPRGRREPPQGRGRPGPGAHPDGPSGAVEIHGLDLDPQIAAPAFERIVAIADEVSGRLKAAGTDVPLSRVQAHGLPAAAARLPRRATTISRSPTTSPRNSSTRRRPTTTARTTGPDGRTRRRRPGRRRPGRRWPRRRWWPRQRSRSDAVARTTRAADDDGPRGRGPETQRPGCSRLALVMLARRRRRRASGSTDDLAASHLGEPWPTHPDLDAVTGRHTTDPETTCDDGRRTADADDG